MKRFLLGIRKEDEEKRFERRVPLTPDDIQKLLAEHPEELEIWVQPSNEKSYTFERCFPDADFLRAGARLSDRLTDCPVILGIKEIAIRHLEPGKTYVFFSHTFKGQTYNMQMLKRLLALGCTVIDYEMIAEDISEEEFAAKRTAATKRKNPTAPASLLTRTVYFGRFAGVSGVIDSLWALGERLSLEGYTSNPFSGLKKALNYCREGEKFGTYHLAVEEIKKAGKRLAEEGLPEELQPLIIGIMGRGNTARGTREVLEYLPCESIDPLQLPGFQPPPHEAKHKIYIAELGREHTKQEIFQDLLPCLTMAMNCVKWQSGEPLLITRELLRQIYGSSSRPRLRVIGDVTCDPGGAVEICRETYPDEPVYTYDPRKDDDPAMDWANEDQRKVLFDKACTSGVGLQGPVVMAVTNLPCEFPRDASIAFSEMLRPYVLDLARTAAGGSFEELPIPRAVQRAIIAYEGRITPDYSYLEEKTQPRNVLVLGAGKVSPELLRHLARAGFNLRVLDRESEAARSRIEALGPGPFAAGRLDVNPETPPSGPLQRFLQGRSRRQSAAAEPSLRCGPGLHRSPGPPSHGIVYRSHSKPARQGPCRRRHPAQRDGPRSGDRPRLRAQDAARKPGPRRRSRVVPILLRGTPGARIREERLEVQVLLAGTGSARRSPAGGQVLRPGYGSLQTTLN